MSADFWQQQQIEQERMELLLEILERVSQGTSTKQDADVLASELGLTHFTRHEKEMA